ncbi:2-hydroxyacid dehydrogenase [Aestuariibius insulae]|uniref:2-hydroxyacid dehydrogenase n=1 Tax=Aestuariibius insulae TaxID=2058287 RepID=UPI00345E1617
MSTNPADPAQILFAATEARWNTYETPLRDAFDEIDLSYRLATELPPDQVDFIIYAPNGPVQDFAPFTRLRAVLNLWAGVENVAGNDTLTAPLARMVDPSLTQGMVEWVLGHTLRHHLGMDAHIVNPGNDWTPAAPPLAEDKRVTILGLGELGLACAEALHRVGFQVAGWSRSRKEAPGIICLHGQDGLVDALRRADILVLLLPLTSQTENLLNADRLAQLPSGSVILNPGRGALIDDDALLEALKRNVAHATLDVFRTEPLPQDHPFWHHPQVTVTPHIASETRPRSAARVIAENVRRGIAGEPLLHLVDRTAGY